MADVDRAYLIQKKIKTYSNTTDHEALCSKYVIRVITFITNLTNELNNCFHKYFTKSAKLGVPEEVVTHMLVPCKPVHTIVIAGVPTGTTTVQK